MTTKIFACFSLPDVSVYVNFIQWKIGKRFFFHRVSNRWAKTSVVEKMKETGQTNSGPHKLTNDTKKWFFRRKKSKGPTCLWRMDKIFYHNGVDETGNRKSLCWTEKMIYNRECWTFNNQGRTSQVKGIFLLWNSGMNSI